MFGADTALVFDALQMAAVIAGVTGGVVYLAVRKPWTKRPDSRETSAPTRSDLELRVQVLERIATDRSIDLAEEIEALREVPRRSDTGMKAESA